VFTVAGGERAGRIAMLWINCAGNLILLHAQRPRYLSINLLPFASPQSTPNSLFNPRLGPAELGPSLREEAPSWTPVRYHPEKTHLMQPS